MKSLKNQFFAVCLIFFFSIFSFSQATITIKLLVDTGNFDPSDLNKSCSFQATWSNSNKVVKSNGNLEEFAIEAFVDDTILWEGVSTSSDISIVDIKKVDRDNDSKIFKNKKHYGKKRGNSNNKTAEGKVRYNTKNKPDYKYKIFFKINHRGATHKIDPKIKVGNKT